MPDVFGYYNTDRNAFDAGQATPGYVDPNSPYPFAASGYDTTMNPDPSMGTNVVLPSGTKHFGPNDPLWIGYIEGKNNDQPVAAVEGSDEAKHYQRQMNTARNQSIIQMLALAAGSASLAGAAPWSSGAGTATTGTPFQAAGEYGAVPGGSVAAGSIPAGAAEASGEFSGSLAGAGAELGATPFQASGEAGAVPGSTGPIPAGATQASGEYGASPGWLSRLTDAAKQYGSPGGGGGSQQPFSAPQLRQGAGGGFLQQVVRPRPNYLGRFGDAVMASQSANDLLLKSKLFSRERL